jgi:replicative DNA helicase
MSDQRTAQRPVSTLANVQAEASLIGSMLSDNRIIDDLNDILKEDDFSNPLHGLIFRTASQMAAAGQAVNAIVLKPYFENMPQMDEMGGPQYLVQISMSCAPPKLAKQLAEQIADLSTRRRVSEAMRLAISELSRIDGQTTVSEAMSAVERELENTTGKSIITHAPVASFVAYAISDMQKPDSKLSCKLVPSFDKGVGAFRKTNLLILGGRPGMAKTATALNLARGYATEGHATAFFSIEMGGVELAERVIADMSYDSPHKLPYEQITNHWLNDNQKRHACRLQGELEGLPLEIFDCPAITTSELKRRIKSWKRNMIATGRSPDLVIVDYLQKMSPTDPRASETDKTSQISRDLKAIAKELDVAIIALCQLSRVCETRDNKRPILSDLRQSGQIEQDADIIVFLYREAYYLRLTCPPEGSPKYDEHQQKITECETAIEFGCAKVRKGKTAIRTADFYGAYQAVRN